MERYQKSKFYNFCRKISGCYSKTVRLGPSLYGYVDGFFIRLLFIFPLLFGKCRAELTPNLNHQDEQTARKLQKQTNVRNRLSQMKRSISLRELLKIHS